jgi:hypothetical protein
MFQHTDKTFFAEDRSFTQFSHGGVRENIETARELDFLIQKSSFLGRRVY